MFSALESRSLNDLAVTNLLLDCHETLLINNEDDSKRIKIFSVSSCITRAYAIYENFITTAISDYLDTLSECVLFSDLDAAFITEYRLGISNILSRIDQERYGHLTHENIIKWYYEAHTGVHPYKFVTDALTRHEQNFRINVLISGFNRIQLKNLQSWLTNHPEINKLYPEEGNRVFQLLESEVNEFVQLRNDASHGTMDSIIGRDSLNRSCDLIKAIIIAVGSFLTKNKLEHQEKVGKVGCIGFVSESFTRNGAFVAKIKAGTELYLNQELFFLDNKNCFVQTISTLRVNNIDTNPVNANADEFEVGIKCPNLVAINTKLYVKQLK
ncbi:hypothetical protein CJD36_011160 [Flavipsychrobacter stenotrophus]|uniref:RiboL-PSP-HEPN domain-containing protein n=1 Tax=Flavipsychrobacter stenotrophus TaxID=2077091 RepID=A0A2S7SVG6_9BACT|nr:MAE_28990/MAE_18760 family HEPN-like nuclease [Flavipsychrobacter stenotrophus]PQJ10526.1 hypothetical protein CJD36_011160 [Flavipsychrobacter stenotrophus]